MNGIPSLTLLIFSVLLADGIGMERSLQGFGISMGGFGFPFKQFFLQQDMFSPKTAQCEDPCKKVEATCKKYRSQCRIVSVKCLFPPCYPIAKCVHNPIQADSSNPCRYNKPVLMTNNQEYTNCFYPGRSCPTESQCVAYTEGSKCCYAPAGCKATSDAVKPTPRPTTSRNVCPAPNDFACSRHSCQDQQDCPFGFFCCRTNCGTRSCYLPMGQSRHRVNVAAMFREARVGIPVNSIVSLRARPSVRLPYSVQPRRRGFGLPGLNSIDKGSCPPMMTIKTCHPDMCYTDADCYLGKCCISRCGKRVCTAGKGRVSFFGGVV